MDRCRDTDTRKIATVFYKTFIEPNLNDESGRKLCRKLPPPPLSCTLATYLGSGHSFANKFSQEFIEANRPFWTSDITENAWNTLFRTALKFEIGLFDSALVQVPDFTLPSAAVHGNCVFSDAEQPAEICHLSGKAVVGPGGNGSGGGSRGSGTMQSKIHFPLGSIPNLNVALANHGTTSPLKVWLQVDCGQTGAPVQRAGHGGAVTGNESGDSARDDYASARIIKAEVYVGCSCIASKDFIPPKTRAFREMMDDGLRFPRLEGALYGPMGCEVTLTLEFGRGAMRFCSVAVSIMP